MAFSLFIGFIIFQRLIELFIAGKNEQWMKAKGAIVFGTRHYPIMVLIHLAFLISTVFEVLYFERELSQLWMLLLFIFILTQAMRVWALMSLGRYWNTKIIVLPGARSVKKGPYRFIKHPNYLVVTVEIVIIPLMFNAFGTVILFTLLNLFILSIRIPAEEDALKKFTEYESEFRDSSRFLPNLLNKYDN